MQNDSQLKNDEGKLNKPFIISLALFLAGSAWVDKSLFEPKLRHSYRVMLGGGFLVLASSFTTAAYACYFLYVAKGNEIDFNCIVLPPAIFVITALLERYSMIARSKITAFLRLAIVVCLSLIISLGLKVGILGPAAQRDTLRAQQVENSRLLEQANAIEMERNSRVKSLEGQINDLTEQARSWDQVANDELLGTGVSHSRNPDVSIRVSTAPGYGERTKNAEAQAAACRQKVKVLRDQLTETDALFSKQLGEAQAKLKTLQHDLDAGNVTVVDMFVGMERMFTSPDKPVRDASNMIYWILTCLSLILETSPILLKIFGNAYAYDNQVHAEDRLFNTLIVYTEKAQATLIALTIKPLEDENLTAEQAEVVLGKLKDLQQKWGNEFKIESSEL